MKIQEQYTKEAQQEYRQSKSERRKAQRLIDKANKRIERLQNNELRSASVALRNLQLETKKFTIKGKKGNELKEYMNKVNDFLAAQTSTIKGLKSYIKDFGNRLQMGTKDLSQIANVMVSNRAVWDIESKLFQFFSNSKSGQNYQYEQLLKRAQEYVKETNDFNEAASLAVNDYRSLIEKATESIIKAIGYQANAEVSEKFAVVGKYFDLD